MEVIIAGFNVDKNVLDSLFNGGFDGIVSSESIAAAYARISRSNLSVDELRKEALLDVEKTRKSNTQIVHEYSHFSIAEHAVFNIDIKGISRLAVEYLEHARLVSYTEKSFRYCNLKNDYIIPKEIKDIGLEEEFVSLMEDQYKLYEKLSDSIYQYYLNKEDGEPLEWTKNQVRDKSKKQGKWLRSLAKDQARYCSSLASTTQLGMTINVRNLEYMIRRLKSYKLVELCELAEKLFNECQLYVPSLLKYQDPISYIDLGYNETLVDLSYLREKDLDYIYLTNPDISFYDCSSFVSNLFPKILSYSTLTNPNIFRLCSNNSSSKENAFDFYRSVLKYVNVHDSLPREFEFVDFTFEVLVSASCYAQLKRHRMSSQIRSNYISIINYIPRSIFNIGIHQDFVTLLNKVKLLYKEIKSEVGTCAAADYVLTQSNMRRVLVKMNARDLYHFFSLRCDKHAGHEIRTLATMMLEICKEKEPMLFMLACGKDDFEETRAELFGEE